MKDRKNPSKMKSLFYDFCYDFVKITGAPPTLLWARPKIYYPFGKPNKKGAIMVSSNHNTFLDPIYVHLAFPWRRMNSLATKDLFRNEFTRKFFNVMHCIIVDKNNFSLTSFHEVVKRLDEGKLVVIFPEGQVNQGADDHMLAFKSGAVLMAHKAGAPILPMYLVRRKSWIQRQRIVVGQPVDISAMLGKMPSMEDLNRATDVLREKELELREYFESLPVYKKLNPETKTIEDKERTENLT